MKTELSIKAKKIVENYFHLNLYGVEFPCPYFKNERGLKNLPVAYTGKGLPQEIEKEAKKIFKRKRSYVKTPINAKHSLMLCDLGVDCSGLVVNVLNEHLKETIQKTIYQVIKYPNVVWRLRALLRPRVNISAALLTGNLNAVPIQPADAKPGDMLRRNPGHILMIEWVDNNDGKITLGYIQSDTVPEWGVQRGQIIIEDATKPLENQTWSVPFDHKTYQEAEDKGLRRLKILNNIGD